MTTPISRRTVISTLAAVALVPVVPVSAKPAARLAMPPCGLQAEQVVLGSLLSDNSADYARYWCVAPQIHAGHFADPVHSLIFRAIGDLIRVGTGRPDAAAIAARLGVALDEVGGSPYLNWIEMCAADAFDEQEGAYLLQQASGSNYEVDNATLTTWRAALSIWLTYRQREREDAALARCTFPEL
jgi:DnaB-like helicase N terminal domain